MSENVQKPQAYVIETGEGSSGRRVTFTLDFDQIQAEIRLPVTAPLSGQEPGLEVYRVLLQRLGTAAQEAAASPQGVLWPRRSQT